MRRLLVLVVAMLPVSPAADDTPIEVQVQMRNVRLHVDETTVLQIARLRGALVSTRGGHPPVFDDKHSFTVRIDSAQIALSMDSLTRLLNTYVFHYDGSPLKNLTVTADGQRLKLNGTVHKGVDLPFTIIADPSVDADGALRLRAHSIKTLGIPAKGLLTFFGVELENLVNLHGRTGMRVVEDTVVIAPSALVPPPRIEGRLQAVRVEPTRVVQIFGPGSLLPLKLPDRVDAQLHVLPGRHAPLRQADDVGRRSGADRREPEGPLRLLSGPLRAAAGGGLLEEHGGARAESVHARLLQGPIAASDRVSC